MSAMQVLVVDDTKSVHAFVKTLFSKVEDVSLTPVMNGKEAVDLFKEGRSFDLVLLDWEMPILNGPDTLLTLKALGVEAPVIMMTTKNSAENIQQMLEAGASEYLMKPFTLDIILEKIEFVTGRTLKHAA